ncbi:NAD(P)H-dependent glycerol-3-phosphate dehydrogenase [Spiribacter vilamensis]|uniref:NAD(P)H-dependent glycerol-3-phosphate dehydrogenase n=1 Tax=Spiribacter vilamensis TaxID=531306 RepID=UPI00102CB69D|nr:NAD(P)H-dependent glycerol-3-phosphate dehydrogenase [Spiribacter vilamensis]TVO61518.1 NAD(P)-dependent glycerol-3-phosphate dehydrogenase [Spiribacter vilamensis]
MAEYAVLGAGSWGTALALVLARSGRDVRLWAHDPDMARAMSATGYNPRHLTDIPLPAAIRPESDLATSVATATTVLVAVPSHAFAATLQALAPVIAAGTPVIWATKGLDNAGGGLLHDVAAATLPDHPLAALSGPSFAGEVARGLPTAIVLACRDRAVGARLCSDFHDERFRVYPSDDLIGVGLGGAVKNILAIATGIADGLGFGANARSGLVTRGLAEVRRLGAALGADDRTLTGLAGLGDLMLTCTDDQSRNRRMGLALGRGESIDTATAGIGAVVEGIRTAVEVGELARRLGVQMPICAAVESIITTGQSPLSAAEALMERRPGAEFDDRPD